MPGALPPKPKGQPAVSGKGRATLTWQQGQDMQATLLDVAKPLNIKGIQRHLRSVGYQVPVNGKVTPLFKNALRDYLKPGKHGLGPQMAKLLRGTKLTSLRDPKAWNQRYGTGPNPHVDKPLMGSGGQLDKFGNNVPGRQPASGMDGVVQIPSGGLPRFAPLGAQGLPGGAQLLGPGMVDQIGNAFNPVVNDLMQQQQAVRRATGRNADEVRGWYGQVTDHLGKAANYDKAINRAAVGSMRDATQAIVGSLGGSANEGSPMVGAAGAQAVGTLGALGSAQEQYNADMAPLLEGEGAGMAARVTSQGAKNAAELASRIAEVQAQRSAARAEAMMNIAQINNEIRNGRYDRALQLKQYNDSLKQNDFNNQVTLSQLQAAAMGLGAKTSRGPATSYTWAKAPQSIRNAAATQVSNAIEGMTYPQALQQANEIIRGYGWSLKNPAVVAFRNDMLRQAGIKVDPRTK